MNHLLTLIQLGIFNGITHFEHCLSIASSMVYQSLSIESTTLLKNVRGNFTLE
jgi:hypothetical protein